MTRTIVEIDGLKVSVGDRTIVDEVCLSIRSGEILGLVGESGSGKTTVAMSLLGYTRHGARITGGRVRVNGDDVLAMGGEQRRALRGRVVSYVPQDPRAALNPSITIGRQLDEVLEVGTDLSPADRREAVRVALADVGLPNDTRFTKRYPHQLSGGQLQRVAIAMGIVGQPPVIVFDEPTTGLDVTTQRRILDLVRELCTEHGIAGLYVTHDLAVVADVADRVAVMRSGVLVEEGEMESVFLHPQSDYTTRLLAAAPDLHGSGPGQLSGRAPADRGGPKPVAILTVDTLTAGYRSHTVLQQVSTELFPGECLAIVGESGSGKTTLSRAIIGLHPNYSGEVRWRDEVLPRRATRRSRAMVKDLQYIFQSPFNAFNPRMTIGESIGFAHKLAFKSGRTDRREAVQEAVAKVGLSAKVLDQLPNRLSGGERQRAALARALVTRPSVLVCDEITSSLDVIIQAAVIELLSELKRQDGLSLLFVTHNLALLPGFADRLIVIDKGNVVEAGATVDVLADPQNTYTRQLLRDVVSIRGTLAQKVRLPPDDRGDELDEHAAAGAR